MTSIFDRPEDAEFWSEGGIYYRRSDSAASGWLWWEPVHAEWRPSAPQRIGDSVFPLTEKGAPLYDADAFDLEVKVLADMIRRGDVSIATQEEATSSTEFRGSIRPTSWVPLRNIRRQSRPSDQSVTLEFRSCAAASEFQEALARALGLCDGNHGGPECGDKECWLKE